MTAETTTAIEQLADLRQRLADAGRRVQEAEAEVMKSRRALARLQGEISEYWEAVGSGAREPDEEEERRLRTDHLAANALAVFEPSYDRDGKRTSGEYVDTRARGLLVGAKQAREQCQQDLATFARERLGELAAERAPRSRAAAEQMEAARAQLDDADRAWQRESQWWTMVARLAGREDLLESLPDTPLRGLPPHLPGPAPAPMPERLIASEPEEPTA